MVKLLPNTIHDISELKTWPEGWNGYDALAPDPQAVGKAISWITEFYQRLNNLHLRWLAPNVTASADGEVVFEWRQGQKNLTIYIGVQNIAYVKDRGIDIEDAIDNGYITSADMSLQLWIWLIS